MIRGLNASKLGMAAEQARSEVLANNLANLNTPGFKRSVAVTTEFEAMLLHRMDDPTDAKVPQVGVLGNGAILDQVTPVESQGQIVPTERDLDFALDGPGRFIARGPGGQLLYTRNGAFTQSEDGTLVTQEGYPILIEDPTGQQVTVNIATGTPVVGIDGTIRVNDQVVGRLALEGATADTKVVNRALETANVELAKEMADLIMTLRSFQVNQRALSMQDQTLAKAVTEIGKV